MSSALTKKIQFGPIKGTHAYVLWAIRDIEVGDSITVQYTLDTSYFPDGCCCGTCNPQQPPVASRRIAGVGSEQNKDSGTGLVKKKRTRRAGKRVPKRKPAVNEEIDTDI